MIHDTLTLCCNLNRVVSSQLGYESRLLGLELRSERDQSGSSLRLATYDLRRELDLCKVERALRHRSPTVCLQRHQTGRAVIEWTLCVSVLGIRVIRSTGTTSAQSRRRKVWVIGPRTVCSQRGRTIRKPSQSQPGLYPQKCITVWLELHFAFLFFSRMNTSREGKKQTTLSTLFLSFSFSTKKATRRRPARFSSRCLIATGTVHTEVSE